MIEFFESLDVANIWLRAHPEWRPVGISAGHLAGSILIIFETRYSQSLNKVSFDAPAKRRGRPPKVKSDASS